MMYILNNRNLALIFIVVIHPNKYCCSHDNMYYTYIACTSTNHNIMKE